MQYIQSLCSNITQCRRVLRSGLMLFLLVVFTGLAMGGCGSSSDLSAGAGGPGDGSIGGPGGGKNTGALALLLTDDPSEGFSKVIVTVKSIVLLSEDKEAVEVFEGSRRIDLLSLDEVEDLFLLDDGIPVGNYTKIRLKVEDPLFVKKDGTEISSDQIQLVANGKIDLIPKEGIRIVSGGTLVVRIDFDAKKSIHIHSASSKYKLRPVIFVTIINDFKDHLLSVKGRIESIRPDDRSFLLKRTRHHLAHLDDDDQERPYRIRVFVSENTRIFDESGSPSDFSALALEQFVHVKGILSREPLLSLKARLIEIGEPLRLQGTIKKGVEAFGDDEDQRFIFLPDPGQGFIGEVLVFFNETSLILEGGSHKEVDPSLLTTGRRVIIKGVLDLSDATAQFKAAVIVIKTGGSLQERLEGRVSEIDRNRRTFRLIRDVGDPVWVHVPADAFILRVHQEEGDASLEAERVEFDALENGQEVVIFGVPRPALFSGDPEFEAAVVLIDAAAEGFKTIAQGESSGITTPRLETIGNQTDWDRFWGAHSGGSSSVPTVDFNLHQVLVVHLGNRATTGYRIDITRVDDSAGNLDVHYTETVPGVNCLVNPVLTQPHHIVLLEKTTSLLRFAETKVVSNCR